MKKELVTYVVKVKLPEVKLVDADNTEYEWERNQSIFAVKPEGFEVCWTELPSWPIDKDGYTWVTLYCTDQRKAVKYFIGVAASYRHKIEQIKEII